MGLIDVFNRQEVEYAEILRLSQKRLVTTVAEENRIHSSAGNVKLRWELQKDL